MSRIGSIMRGLGQGATFGLSDEATSAIGALYAKAFAPELFRDQGLASLYTQARDEERQKNTSARKTNPYLYGGAELAAGVALPLGSFASGANTLANAMRTGAGFGALGGYGYSDEVKPLGMLKDTATGGILGGALGAGLYGAGKVATNPQVQKFAKDYMADERGALKIPALTKNYYKTPSKHGDKLEDFLSQNNIEFNREKAGSGSEYFTIYKPDGGQLTARLADHSNQAAGTSKNSYNYQIYPDDGGMGGGGSIEKLINDLSEKYGLSYTEPKKPIKPKITKDDLIYRYGRTGSDASKYEQAAMERIKGDLKYSDGLFKDLYGMSKEKIKKIMGIE